MSQIVVLSPTATAGIVPLGLMLLLNAGHRRYYGVARLTTIHRAKATLSTVHYGEAKATTTYKAVARV